MDVDLSAASLVRAGSGLLFVAFGVVVLALARGRAANRLLGAFAVLFGAPFIAWNLLARDPDVAAPLSMGRIVVDLAGTAVALVATYAVPTRDLSAARWGWIAAGALAAVVVPATAGLDPVATAVHLGGPESAAAFYHASTVSLAALASALVGWGVALAVRARRDPSPALPALALGVLPWAVYLFAEFPTLFWPAFPTAATIVALGAVAGVAALWILAAKAGHGRAAVVVAWVVAASGCLGALDSAGRGFAGGTTIGLLRAISVAALAYAVLRGGLLGYALAVPAVRRGTVAAAVLVGFFVVAQVAQEFLSDSMGVVVGGVAAGALLFAALPLQRAAENLVARERPRQASGDAHVRETYRLAVRAALADGAMTRSEEVHLADLAQHLGLGAADALRVRHEVEAEMGA